MHSPARLCRSSSTAYWLSIISIKDCASTDSVPCRKPVRVPTGLGTLLTGPVAGTNLKKPAAAGRLSSLRGEAPFACEIARLPGTSGYDRRREAGSSATRTNDPLQGSRWRARSRLQPHLRRRSSLTALPPHLDELQPGGGISTNLYARRDALQVRTATFGSNFPTTFAICSSPWPTPMHSSWFLAVMPSLSTDIPVRRRL